MSNVNAYLQSFNGGELGQYMIGRTGIASYQTAAETVENWLPTAQGPLTRRGGLKFIDAFDPGSTAIDDIRLLKFQFDITQNYLLVTRPKSFLFYQNGAQLQLPAAVPGAFDSGSDQSGPGASGLALGNSIYELTSNGAGQAIRRFHGTVRPQDASQYHVFSFQVTGGPIDISFGSTPGGADYGNFTGLNNGYHQLGFVPQKFASDVYVDFAFQGNTSKFFTQPVWLNQSQNVPYTLYNEFEAGDLVNIRLAQSGDRVWVFSNKRTQLIERRGEYSWSFVQFNPVDGPFGQYGDPGTYITASGSVGEIALTATKPIFDKTYSNRLLRLFTPGQYVEEYTAKDSYYTQPITVSGIDGDRTFTITIDGISGSSIYNGASNRNESSLTINTYVPGQLYGSSDAQVVKTSSVGTGSNGTIVTLERSVGTKNQFTPVCTYTGNQTIKVNDSYQLDGTDASLYNASGGAATANTAATSGLLNNQTIYYRLSIRQGDFTSGVVKLSLSSPQGSTVGIVRVRNPNGLTAVATVLSKLGSSNKTNTWQPGYWAEGGNGFPTVGCFAKGRLFTALGLVIQSSNSDSYFSFDDGAALYTAAPATASINVSIQSRASSGIRWMAYLDYLCFGTQQEEWVAHSNTPTDSLNPQTFEAELWTEEGGASLEAVTGGTSVCFVHRTKKKLYQFAHNPRALTASAFTSTDLTRLHPDILLSEAVRIDMQMEPEHRVFVVTKDGQCKLLLLRREEEITAWSRVSTDGFIIDVSIIKEQDQDVPYFLIRREVQVNYGGVQQTTYTYTLEAMQRELPVNDWEFIHLDSYLTTPFDQSRKGNILPSSLNIGDAVTVSSDTQQTFVAADVGRILWIDNGAIAITGYTSDRLISGTVTKQLLGMLNQKGDRVPQIVRPNRYGLADVTGSVSGVPHHLLGVDVWAWADGIPYGPLLATPNIDGLDPLTAKGTLALPNGVKASRIQIGKLMTSRWKSMKIAYGAQKGTAITQKKKIVQAGFILNRSAPGLYAGVDFDLLDLVQGSLGQVVQDYAAPLFTGEIPLQNLNGQYDTDTRLCLAVLDPAPCTIIGVVLNVQTHER